MKLLVVVVLFLSSITINAQNWPSFRGPNASGVADGTNPPTTWDLAKSQTVLWKTNIPGLSHSSPIIWGNQIFVITAVSGNPKPPYQPKDRGIDLATDDTKHTWMIFALDKRDGRVLWSDKPYEGVPRAKRHVKATQANSTPVTDGRYVVALFGSEGLACYDLKGKLLWEQDLGVLNPGLWDDKDSSWGHGSSPIIYRDLVIVQADPPSI
jgi:outer membrane protein assembly factor BamB